MTEMQKMVKVIKAEPGIRSAKLAQKLGMTSLRCAMLGRRLAKQGKIVIERQPTAPLPTASPDGRHPPVHRALPGLRGPGQSPVASKVIPWPSTSTSRLSALKTSKS
jgi:hypothetical protein